MLFIILPAAYLGLMVLVFLTQRRMLYHPSRAPLESLVKIAATHGFDPWRNAAGECIGWKRLARTAAPHDRVLIVHGNAGSAIDRVDYADGVAGVAPWDVYILEYPGYGARAGSPTQESLFRAADEAIALLEKDGPVFLIGESLGTGVAAYLAGTHPKAVSGVLLVAPYHNLTEVAQHHMRIFPVSWLLLDRFPSAKYLREYHGPAGMILAGRDEVIPNRFGRHLYDDYAGPKKLWVIPDAYHNDLPYQSAEWWEELVSFWKGGTPSNATMAH
jgi:uncharacterized protein